MERDLRDLAEEFGDDELVDRVERLEDELDEVLADLHDEMEEEDELDQFLTEETDLNESSIEDMSLQAKREVAEEFGLGDDRTNERVNVAGQPNRVPEESSDVTVNHSGSETYEKEVPVTPVAGEVNDDPETKTVEYEETGPALEEVVSWRSKMHQRFIEENERAEERAKQRREEQDGGHIPTGVVNLDEVDEMDEDNDDIPVAGEVDPEEE